MFFLFPPATGNWNCKYAATCSTRTRLKQPKSDATTLIINVLIILAITRNAAAITVPPTAAASAETTLHQSNYEIEVGAAKSEAASTVAGGGETKLVTLSGLPEGTSPEYIQNYYRTNAGNVERQQQQQEIQNQQQPNKQQQTQTSIHAYANDVNEKQEGATALGENRNGEREHIATMRDNISQFRLRGEALGSITESGFMPTTMTAAGQHYATTAGIAASQSAAATQAQTKVAATSTAATAGGGTVTQNHGLITEYEAPPGKVGYEINSENYDSDNTAYSAYNIANEMLDATGLPLGNLSPTQKDFTAASAGIFNNYYNYYNNDNDNFNEELFKNYFTPTNFQMAHNQYLHDLKQIEQQYASYKQQQQQELQIDNTALSLPRTSGFDNNDLLQQELSQQPGMQSLFNIKQKRHQESNSPQQQLQPTGSEENQQQSIRDQKELQQHERSFNQQQQQLSNLGRQEEKQNHNADSSGVKIRQQDQTKRNIESTAVDGSNLQSHYFYPENEIDVEEQRMSSIRHMQQLMQQQQQEFEELQHQLLNQNSQDLPTLPPITSTEHHTPISSAAASGIPLHKHIEVTKNIPVHNYHQVQVPYMQKVPIEIPNPVITTVPRPFPIKVPVTQTVAVPQMQEVKIPVEKVKPFPVERPVPFLVDKHVPYNVERQVASPVYYPYPIKVPILKTIYHKLPTAHIHHRHQLHTPLKYNHLLSPLQYHNPSVLRNLRNFHGRLG